MRVLKYFPRHYGRGTLPSLTWQSFGNVNYIRRKVSEFLVQNGLDQSGQDSSVLGCQGLS
jgi:hypothetical protein